MADDPEGRLRNINVYYPNPVLAAFLKGPRIRSEVERITAEVFNIYQASLPVRTGNLREGAYYYLQLDGWGQGERDRWFGYVGNKAVSYRGKKGVRYGPFIEYGKPSRGIAGQHQLARAANIVFGEGTVPIRGRRASTAPEPTFRKRTDRNPKTGLKNFRDRKGRFTRNPTRNYQD